MINMEDVRSGRRMHTDEYLQKIGVGKIPPLTSPFDPGYDPLTLEGHLEQSHRMMSILKISMACWLIADEEVTRRKVAAARDYNVPTVTGGGPFVIAVAQRRLPEYLDLCADIGVTRIECGEGSVDTPLKAKDVVTMAGDRALEVQFELGLHDGRKTDGDAIDLIMEQGERWLEAGAQQLVVDAHRNAQGVRLFDDAGTLNTRLADRVAKTYGLHSVMFEAPAPGNQFALLDFFGPDVHLCNVRLEDILTAEIYRRGLHSDAFRKENLRPKIDREFVRV